MTTLKIVLAVGGTMALGLAGATEIPSLPERTDEGYDASPYVINGAEGPLVELKRLSGAATLPVQETSGATYRYVVDGTANEFHYDGGTWNLYNPFGTLSNCQLNFAGGSGANQTANRIYIHGGAITGGRMQFVAAAEENLLCVDGGQHVFNGSFGFVSSSRSGSGLTPRTYVVEVSGEGTSLKTTSWLYLFSNDDNGGTSGHAQDTLLVRVKDGATMEMCHAIDRAEGHYRFEVSNGATFKNSGWSYLAYGANHPFEIVVNDSTYIQNNNYIGREDWMTFAATNSTIKLGNSENGWTGDRLIYNFKNCAVENLIGVKGTAVVSGGSVAGCTVAGNGRVYLSDLTLSGQSCIYANGTDAQLFLTNVTVGSGFYIGHAGSNAGAVGTVTFCGGSYLHQYYEFWIGKGDSSSVGTVNFEDGDYMFNCMSAGFEPRNAFHIGVDGTGTFNMRGGTVTGYSPILAVNAGSTGTLNMDGGTWYVKGLRVGAGTSILNGDGGTMVPRVANESFISGLTTATVGAKGLLIDTGTTGYALTIPQAFANKTGTEAGVLRLKGASPITITGANTCAKIRIEGGSHIIAADQSSTVEVIGGGRLDFADETADTITLGGLILGESASAGTLAIESDDAITVTGALDFPNGFVALSDDFTLGEHILIRTTSAELTPAVRTAWSRVTVSEGAVAGLVYRFSTKVVDDVEVLTLVIEEKKELGGNVNWQGGSDWSSGSSWAGGKAPSDTEIATFVEGAGTKDVALSSPVTIGALAFNADGYTISGAGTITLSSAVSGYIAGTSGTNEVAVGMSFSGEYPITVDEGAKLVLSGPLTGGVPVKRGAGELELSGANSFSGGIRAEAGTLTVIGADAFGYNGAASANDVTLAGGDLVFCGDAAGETTAMTLIAAKEGTDVTRVTTETPLAMGAYAPVSGAFEKRGAANLTLTATNGRELTPGDGDMTVAEGSLTLKGATSDAMTLKKSIRVGEASVEAAATPTLTLDGLRINNGTTAGTITIADKSALAMTNGAVVYVNSVCLNSTNTVSVDSSVLIGQNNLQFGSATEDRPMALRVTNRGRLSTYADCVPAYWSGTLDAIFDHSTLTRTSRTLYEYDFDYDFFPIYLQATGSASGTILFRNKSEFACRGLDRSYHFYYHPTLGDTYPYYTNAVTIAFDDAVLSCSHYNLNLRVPHPQNFVTEVREGGLTIDLINCSSAYIRKALTGAGGITVTGSGKTLVFDREMDRLYYYGGFTEFFYLEGDHPTYCCEGVLKAESGVTIKLMAGSIRPDAKIELAAGAVLDLDDGTIEIDEIAGAGTVKNGTLKVRTLRMDDSGATLTFDGATLAAKRSRLFVDFGRTELNPLDYRNKAITLATFANVAQGALGVKGVNTGTGALSGAAAVADGKLQATLTSSGLTLLVR